MEPKSSRYTFNSLRAEISAQKDRVRAQYKGIGRVAFGESYVEVFDERTRIVTPYVVTQKGGTVTATETTII